LLHQTALQYSSVFVLHLGLIMIADFCTVVGTLNKNMQKQNISQVSLYKSTALQMKENDFY
jgi:hypothetical protein